jgi:serine protease AprX
MPRLGRGDPPSRTLDRKLVEQLMLGTGRVRRYTQDSPVLPDVWLEFAKGAGDEPLLPVKLLLTPYRDTTAGDLRRELRRRIESERRSEEWRVFGHDAAVLPRMIYNQTTVAAVLHFEDLVRGVLPLTDWWCRLNEKWPLQGLQAPAVQRKLAQAVQNPEQPVMIGTDREDAAELHLPAALLWLLRVVGALAVVRKGARLPAPFLDPRRGVDGAVARDWLVLVKAVADLIRGVEPAPARALVYSVSLNREAGPTISRSTLAVKADAARLLFNISCEKLAWGIVDSGVDARHPAFRVRDRAGMIAKHEFVSDDGRVKNQSRVVATYDFTQIELLLDPECADQPARVKKLLQGETERSRELRRQLAELNASLAAGRAIDWKLIADFLRIPHQDGEYVPPAMDHGTHVAGILASDWRAVDSERILLEEDLIGVCPNIRLYDLRVLDREGRGDEFAVMAALQFVRYLNSTNDYMVVHGVNLSLSIPHDVTNYACGRTPVCDECERVVSAGVVVVAAAGNGGFRKEAGADGTTTEAYSSISITDPGNADLVLTVGATHRFRPHTYGVSYFSSRGPTGDGRRKPDLVAPGEKITAPLPGGLFGLKDGTSMAAPHVSGAAALLMARYNELIGQPGRVKQILCDTATDLGRERYFQGAGMLDTLRALQSV